MPSASKQPEDCWVYPLDPWVYHREGGMLTLGTKRKLRWGKIGTFNTTHQRGQTCRNRGKNGRQIVQVSTESLGVERVQQENTCAV